MEELVLLGLQSDKTCYVYFQMNVKEVLKINLASSAGS